MDNSAISRSNSSKINNKLSQQGLYHTIKSKNTVKSFEQYSQSNQQESQQKQIHFTPFRKQHGKKQSKQYSKIQIGNKNNIFQPQKSTPLFYSFKNSDQLFPSYAVETDKRLDKYISNQKIQKDLVKTKHTLKQSLDNSLNDSLHRSEIQINNKKQIHHNEHHKPNIFFRQKENNEHLMFGQGLQQIDSKQQKVEFIHNSNLEIEQKPLHKSLNSAQKNQYSNYNPALSKNVIQKRLSYLQSGIVDYRSTGRNFFKRPTNSSHSQEYLKSHLREKSKQSILNGKLSIHSSKEKQSKGSIFLKTQPFSKDRNDSYISYRNKYLPMLYENLQNQSRKSQQHYLSFAKNINKIVFKYNGGHATTLYNYRVKIKNQSKLNLGVKIKCTSPRHYQVSPCYEKILQPLQILSLSIEMKLYPHDLNPTTMKHDLSRYKNDKFMILYWTAQLHNDFDYYQGQRILPVFIQQTEEQKIRNEGLSKNINDQKTKQATQQKEIQMYKKLINTNNLKINQLDAKIKKIQSMEYKDKYFTLHLFILFVIVGLIIGICLG